MSDASTLTFSVMFNKCTVFLHNQLYGTIASNEHIKVLQNILLNISNFLSIRI